MLFLTLVFGLSQHNHQFLSLDTLSDESMLIGLMNGDWKSNLPNNLKSLLATNYTLPSFTHQHFEKRLHSFSTHNDDKSHKFTI